MAKQKGATKTGGRKKGTPNKKTLILGEVLESLHCDVPARLVELIPKLEPEKQSNVLLELMSYLYPKRKALELTGSNGSPLQVETISSGERQSKIEELIEKRNLIRSSTD